MTRYVGNTALQLVIEPSYGGGPTTFGPTDTILVSSAEFDIDRDLVPRNLLRPWMGDSEHLIGTRRAQLRFAVELAGSGAAGTAPAWGRLLRVCGMAETAFAGSRVEYTPVSTAFESAAVRFFRDGVIYVSRGCRGTVRLELKAYDRPMAVFEIQGFDTTAIEGALPNVDYTAWKTPEILTDANSADIVFGGTFLAGAITGGTDYPSEGCTLDLGQRLTHRKLLGAEAIHIVGRATSGNATLQLTAAQEVAWRTDLNANTLTSFGFRHGSAAGSRITVWGPKVQRVAPKFRDSDGLVMLDTELRFLPVSGNDELRIIAA